MESPRPLVFDIKRHALEDGPGIRTTVFFKGCQLRCWWCQNPESLEAEPEIGFYAADCLGCGECVTVCQQGAVSLDNPARIDRRRCNRCGDCAAVCPGGGLRLIGKYYPVEELRDKLLRDRAFYKVSGGGVTLSGGEPTLHMAYVSLLLQALKQEGIHLALQTNGFFDWAEFADNLLDFLDLIMFDVKMANPSEHLKYTGQENGLILANLGRLLEARPEAVLPRIPLIPGITATERNLREISRLLQGLHVNRCSLLPYNSTGYAKADHIGKAVSPQLSLGMMSAAEEQQCREIFAWAELVSF
jgi:pyruvate formate lyase activating enzyme